VLFDEAAGQTEAEHGDLGGDLAPAPFSLLVSHGASETEHPPSMGT
jgi:hypothetical protein